jgi:hypothetical protein
MPGPLSQGTNSDTEDIEEEPPVPERELLPRNEDNGDFGIGVDGKAES